MGTGAKKEEKKEGEMGDRTPVATTSSGTLARLRLGAETQRHPSAESFTREATATQRQDRRNEKGT